MASQEDTEVRFAELLHPIRDLTKNWEVDIAKYLEDYIEHIHHLCFTFDGGSTTVNFAEAALLVQGSAAVYGKKVDFLWSLVLQMMELLQGGKAKKAAEEAGDNEASFRPKKGKRHSWVTPGTWESLDDVPIGKQTRLRNESLSDLRDVTSLQVRMPNELLAFKTSNDSTSTNFRDKVLSLKGDEVLGFTSDFKSTLPFDPESGFIGHSGSTNRGTIEHFPEIEFGLAQDEQVGAAQSMNQVNQSQATEVNQDLDPNIDDPTRSDTSLSDIDRYNPQRPALREKRPVNLPIYEDPWAPLDPHQATGVQKPYRKGKTIRMPPEMEAKTVVEKKRARNTVPILPPIDQYIRQAFYLPAYENAKGYRKPLPEFQLEMSLCHERLKMAKQKLKKVKSVIKKDGASSESDEHSDDDEVHGIQVGGESWQNDVDTAQKELDAIFDDRVDLGLDENKDVVLSYEQLVQNAVAAHMISAQNMVLATDLSKRVSEWHNRMRPILEDVEDRQSFDIHAYGLGILKKFTPDSKVLPFEDIVRGKPRYEISRYFLSSLQLANNQNVSLSLTNPEPLAMDCLQLEFLSNRSHQEDLDNFGRENISD